MEMTEALRAAMARVYDHFALAEFRHERDCIENGDLEPGQRHIASALRTIGRAIGRDLMTLEDYLEEMGIEFEPEDLEKLRGPPACSKS
jgi:hypothetical protein